MGDHTHSLVVKVGGTNWENEAVKYSTKYAPDVPKVTGRLHGGISTKTRNEWEDDFHKIMIKMLYIQVTTKVNGLFIKVSTFTLSQNSYVLE